MYAFLTFLAAQLPVCRCYYSLAQIGVGVTSGNITAEPGFSGFVESPRPIPSPSPVPSPLPVPSPAPGEAAETHVLSILCKHEGFDCFSGVRFCTLAASPATASPLRPLTDACLLCSSRAYTYKRRAGAWPCPRASARPSASASACARPRPGPCAGPQPCSRPHPRPYSW